MKRDNRGLTLIELVIAIAMTAVVLLMVTYLLEQGSRYFKNSKEELELQKEAQMTMSQLNQMVLNARELTLDTQADKTVLKLFMTGEEQEEIEVSFVDGELLLSKKKNGSIVYTDRLLARKVAGFFVTLPTEESNTVQIELTFAWNKKQYRTVQSVALRNRRKAE